MHVIIVNYVYKPELHTPHKLLRSYFGLTGWVDGLTASGARVTVFQRYHDDFKLMLNDAEYLFVSDNLDPRLRLYQIPTRINFMISNYINDNLSNQTEIILHVNGLIFPTQIFHLRMSTKKTAIVVQHHAERFNTGFKGLLQRIFLRYVDGFIFSTQEHARAWKKAGIIKNDHIIGEIMEISSVLRYESRDSARKQTGLQGDPIVLWTGNLNRNKDPLTILSGFEIILQDASKAHLYMAYRYAGLLTAVENYINSSENLKKTVTILGTIPYSEIAQYYNSADFFVQGSHHEGSGIALLDALACGVVPVVTDIPSFRVITDNGRIGALWEGGNSRDFAEAFLSLLQYPLEKLSAEARYQFENKFRFDKLGLKAVDFYQDVIQWKARS